jgi:predicted DNA-binding transcriptional regulator AlpA
MDAIPTNETLPEWFRPRDLRRRYGVSDVTLWRWRERGILPAPVKLGNTRSLFWKRADILAFEAARGEAKS